MTTTLFDWQAAEQAKQDAIARVEAHGGEALMEDVVWAIEVVASASATFTTDNVWALLSVHGIPVPEGRFMGAAVREAQRRGIIAPTDTWRLSDRRECHRRPLRVWRSLRRQAA